MASASIASSSSSSTRTRDSQAPSRAHHPRSRSCATVAVQARSSQAASASRAARAQGWGCSFFESKAAPARRGSSCACRAAEPQQRQPSTYLPFQDEEYHQVTFLQPPYGPMKLFEDSTFNGVLVFKREADVQGSDDLSVLEVFIAGDTAFNTWSLLTHRLMERPMVHELMYTLLERAHSSDSRNWGLLRAAIVELRDNVFIGRLFFGDKETGEVMWDCDCRPSDGIYLSLKAQSPFYIHHRVWEQAALPIRASSVFKIVASSTQHASSSSTTSNSTSSGPSNSNSNSTTDASPPPPPPSPFAAGYPEGPGGSGSTPYFRGGTPGRASYHDHEEQAPPPLPPQWSGAPVNAMATPDTLTMEDVSFIRPDDPEAIKLLKRKLVVAVREENYREAARIRDHRWMLMYREVHALRLRGRYEEAHYAEVALQEDIDETDSGAQ